MDQSKFVKGMLTGEVHIYHQLMHQKTERLLQSFYPLTYSTLDTSIWNQLITDFTTNYPNPYPETVKINLAFKEYAKSLSHPVPYLKDLLIFEYLLDDVIHMPDINPPSFQTHGDLAKDRLILNPEHHFQTFEYPVFNNPQPALSGEYFLFLYRHPLTLDVHMIELTPPYYEALKKLAKHPLTLAEVSPNPQKETFAFFERLILEKAVLGYQEKPCIIDASGRNTCTPYAIRPIQSRTCIQQALTDAKTLQRKIVMFGAKHSQAGQICQEGALALDMRPFNQVLDLDVSSKKITVQSGIFWEEIQKVIRPHGLALQIMQFVNTFSVAGSMSANIFSRDPRKSRLIETIISFNLMDHTGKILHCSREENRELFTLAIGGHGLFGVILEVVIQLTDDLPLEFLEGNSLLAEDYFHHFIPQMKNDPLVAYHDAYYTLDRHDFMNKIYTDTFRELPHPTLESFTRNDLMMAPREKELIFGNPEGSDVLLGFFIPFKNGYQFHLKAKEIIQPIQLPLLKCSINYLPGGDESYLTVPFGECYKFALLYHQRKAEEGQLLKEKLTQAAYDCQGSIYLTFDFYTHAQEMEKFYPNWKDFIHLKRKYDPDELFYSNFYSKLLELKKH